MLLYGLFQQEPIVQVAVKWSSYEYESQVQVCPRILSSGGMQEIDSAAKYGKFRFNLNRVNAAEDRIIPKIKRDK